MNRLLTALALGGSGLLAAAPAAAHSVFSISIGSGGYGYSSPYAYDYNQGYGYNSGWGQTEAFQARISNVFQSLGSVRPDQRYQIRAEAIALNRELRIASANGLDPYELSSLDARLSRLERREQWASINSWNNVYNGYNGYYGNNRDRDDEGDRDDDGD